MNREKKYVILVAGGKGSRMDSSVPKQFLTVKGMPLLMHTFFAFASAKMDLHFILVLPAKHIDLWKKLCEGLSFQIPHQIAEGGPERFHSVKSGLKLIPEEEALVAVHDAVRPFVDPALIGRVFQDASFHGNAVPVIDIPESLRERTGMVSRPADRTKYLVVQTPQCFRAGLLKKAYLQTYREDYTDDATVAEQDGLQIHLVRGDPANLKITTPRDLQIASCLLPETY